jgi:hypothetical protein
MGETNQRSNTPPEISSLAGPPREGEGRRMPESEMRAGFRAIGVAVSRLARPIIARAGGGILVRLKADWAAIVGAQWAEVSWPDGLGRDGALKLRVGSGAAIELQHRAPLMIERINLFFGRTVVSRLVLVQGPLPLTATLAGSGAPMLAPAEEGPVEERLSGVADPDLRTALARLGQAMAGRNG